MAEVKIVATKRAGTGKGPARRARAAGRVPAIVYGRGMEPVAIEVDRRDLALAYHSDAGLNVLLEIELDGSSTLALTKELQRDPVKGTLLHADFIKVDRTQAVEVEVPVHLIGESAGVKEGGVLEQPVHALLVRCLPSEVPEAIEADVTALGIGDVLRVGELRPSEDVEIQTDPDTVVASVAAPISEAQLEAMEAAVTEVAPEVAAAEVPPTEEGPTEPAGEAAAEGQE